MVSKEHRFHGQGSVRYVLRRGQSVRGEGLTLRFVRNQQHPDYRVGVVVSKKVSKSAPKRNRIRRRLFETVRQLKPALGPDVDVILLVFDAGLADLAQSKLDQLVKELVGQAKLNNN